MVYCELCGAANTVDAEVCFACQKSMEQEQEQALPTTTVLRPEPEKNETLLVPGNALLYERYRVLKQVGTGGFGAVYKATDTHANNRFVAIKQINLKGLKSNEIIEATDTFNREVEILSDLEHKSLPRIYEHFTDSEHWYVVMDFIDGQTLEDYLLTTKGRLPLEEILDLGIQICVVLEYLHTRVPPVIFRDLKPANVMLTPYKQIYLIDFGTARFFKPGKAKDTIAFGSPGYAAPEQYGKAQTTPRSDLYSLGATMHQLLTGKDPADASFRFTSPRNSNPALPVELDTLIMNMVKMDVKERPADAYVVKTELQRIATEHGRRLYPLPNALPLYQPNPNRRPVPGGSSVFASLGAGFYPGSGSGSAQGQSQMQFQVGAPAQNNQTAQSSPGKRGGVSRRAIIGGLIVLSVLGPRLLGDWSQPQQQDQYRGNGGRHYPDDRSTTQIYDAQMTFLQQNPVNDASWSNMGAGDWIASSDIQGGLVVWRADSAYPVFHYYGQVSINALAWAPDGQKIAFVNDQGKLTIANWAQQRSRSSQVVQDTSLKLKTVAWSHDGHYIAFGGEDQQVTIVSADNPSQLITRYDTHKGTITSIKWSPNDNRIASASADATVQVWSPSQVQNYADPNAIIYRGHSYEVNAVSWSPDASNIASAGNDAVAQVWDASSGTLSASFTGHSNAVTSVAWSPDGNRVASGGMDRTVQVWSPQDASVADYAYNGHSGEITAITWGSDGQTIASGSTDTSVQVWRLN